MNDAEKRQSAIEDNAVGKKGLISKVLSPAIQLWLRSQVEQVETLQVNITAGDRQILSGTIPQVHLLAKRAVYQGLHLSHVDLLGQNIRVNLGQVMRGKALELLEPIAVTGQINLLSVDLNASLNAPLLADAIRLFLQDLLRSSDALDLDNEASSSESLNLENLQIRLLPDVLRLRADLRSQSGKTTEIALQSGLQLAAPNCLVLHQPQWLPHANAKRGLPLDELNGYRFDLGETALEKLTIDEQQITCQGQLWIQP
jgi:hypothetical protein